MKHLLTVQSYLQGGPSGLGEHFVDFGLKWQPHSVLVAGNQAEFAWHVGNAGELPKQSQQNVVKTQWYTLYISGAGLNLQKYFSLTLFV